MTLKSGSISILSQEDDVRTVRTAFKRDIELADAPGDSRKTIEKQWLHVTAVEGRANFSAEVSSERDIAETPPPRPKNTLQHQPRMQKARPGFRVALVLPPARGA